MKKRLYLIGLFILVGVGLFACLYQSSKGVQDVPQHSIESPGDIQVWSIPEFEVWMNAKLAEYEKLVELSSKTYYEKNDEGVYVAREWTQKDIDMYRKLWDEQLQKMKDGYIFTKPIEDGDMVGMFAPGVLN